MKVHTIWKIDRTHHGASAPLVGMVVFFLPGTNSRWAHGKEQLVEAAG
jgi:hypothetical protein